MKKIYFFVLLSALIGLILLPVFLAKPKAKNLVESNGPKVSHEESIKNIDLASEYRIHGHLLSKEGKFEEAAQAYKKAYEINPGSKAVSGLLLAETYEKLNQYDAAVTLLDQMIQNGELSANGVKNANLIKERLLTAKSQQQTGRSPEHTGRSPGGKH